MTRHREAGRPANKRLQMKKLCAGLYMDTRRGFSISHELVWEKHAGRKWIASWKTSLMGLGGNLDEHKKKFDTFAEARAHLQSILDTSR